MQFFKIITLSMCISILSISWTYAQTVLYKSKSVTLMLPPPPPTEELLEEYKLLIDNTIKYKEGVGIADGVKRIFTEYEVIQKGDSARILIVFDNAWIERSVERIVIEGVGETTDEDIKNGFFVVTVKPEKTTLYKMTIYTKDSDGKLASHIEKRRIVVIDKQKKFEKALKQVWILENSVRDSEDRINKYLDKFSDGVPSK